ncbi:hypothetical protein OHA72_45865 [Dactylosporangium sp. NBC_01737]|uniref:hypothetical protein n=1 Tax=Dactylosporangium sp. NBC_01737 TaxID=2975959 RepID=UPI002E0EF16F|nr:hypothetical protein OHA72_45865 [Dactylosporangium sp. NBC_01737]
MAQYTATRRAVLEALAAHHDETHTSRLDELGRQFGEAFNQLDAADPFIETVEREELFEALDAIVDRAQAEHGRTFDTARHHLTAGVDSVRDW